MFFVSGGVHKFLERALVGERARGFHTISSGEYLPCKNEVWGV